MRLAKNQQHTGERIIPTSAGILFFRGLERLLYLRLIFLHFSLPGAVEGDYQLSMIKKYIGYFRVSTKIQGIDGNGMTAQREIVRRFVSGQSGVLEKEFSEVESGKFSDSDRPQLAAALDYCKRNKATLVIAKLDRLARNAEFLLRLQNSGVDFVCCDCPNADRFTVGILALVAQRERELISERTRLGLAAVKKYKKLGTPNPQKAVAAMISANKSAKLEFAAKVFPIIEEIKSAGVSTLRGICECLNRRGIPTRNGKNWYPATVRNILKIQNV
ncbi:MAG: recombinase family protein [Verrucomicrobiota bacterium]